MVALAATGHRGTASHLSAAWLLGMVDRPPARPHLTICRAGHPLPDGCVVHRPRTAPLPVIVRGFPRTDATRTLVDVAPLVSASRLADMVDRALAGQLTAVPRLEQALQTGERGRTGAGLLRRRLAERGFTGGPAPSVLESRASRLFGRSGLPEPVVQLEVAPDGRTYRLDYAYPTLKLISKVKGYRWHFSPEHLAADDRRQNALARAGWTTLSFDWWAVTRTPEHVAQVIAETYARLAAA